MRKLIAVVLTAAILWSGYWFFGATKIKSTFGDFVSNQPLDAIAMSYNSVSVQGFPNRFDTTLTNLKLTSSDEAIIWSTPFLQILSLSYNPAHVIAVWSNEQTITLPNNVITITTSDLRASGVFHDPSQFALDRGTLAGENIQLRSDTGWRIDATSATASIRQSENPKVYEIAGNINGISFSGPEISGLDPTRIQSRMTIELAHPVSASTPAGQAIEFISITETRVQSGETALVISGDLPVDASGVLNGTLAVQIENWRKVFTNMTTSGILPAESAGGLMAMITMFAVNPDDPENLDLTLTITKGQMFLGPIPLGTAPRLVWN